MSDTSSVVLTAKRESTYATAATGASGITTRMTGEGLKQASETTRSEEIRPDRQTPDIIRKSIGVTGQIRGEFSHTTYDDFLESLLLSTTWTAVVTNGAGNISVQAAAGTITRAAGDFVAEGFLQYAWIKTSGFTAPGNNGWFKILSLTTTVLTVAGPTTLVDEGAAARVVKQGGFITNGTTLNSYTMARMYTDLVTTGEQFVGCCLDKGTMTIPTNDKATVQFDVLGKSGSTVTAPTFTSDAATTTPIIESIDHVPYLMEAVAAGPPGTYPSLGVVDATWNISNNLRQRLQVGTLGPISIGKGQCDVAGQFRVYFQTSTLFNKFLNNTNTTFAFVLQDSSATPKSYVVEFPRVRITDGERVAGGINQDVIARLDFEAFMHETELKTIRISRWP